MRDAFSALVLSAARALCGIAGELDALHATALLAGEFPAAQRGAGAKAKKSHGDAQSTSASARGGLHVQAEAAADSFVLTSLVLEMSFLVEFIGLYWSKNAWAQYFKVGSALWRMQALCPVLSTLLPRSRCFNAYPITFFRLCSDSWFAVSVPFGLPTVASPRDARSPC